MKSINFFEILFFNSIPACLSPCQYCEGMFMRYLFFWKICQRYAPPIHGDSTRHILSAHLSADAGPHEPPVCTLQSRIVAQPHRTTPFCISIFYLQIPKYIVYFLVHLFPLSLSKLSSTSKENRDQDPGPPNPDDVDSHHAHSKLKRTYAC